MEHNNYDIQISNVNDYNNTLYDYQREAIERLNEYFNLDCKIPDRNGLLVMPTGSGKTFTVVNWLLKHCVTRDYQIFWMVHRIELVNQAYNEIRNCIPLLKNSTYHKRKESIRVIPISSDKKGEVPHIHASEAQNADIYVASIQSMYSGIDYIKNMISKTGKEKLIIVIDEAHHGVSNEYQEVVKRIRHYRLSPNSILLGITATPYRMNKSGQGILEEMYNLEKNRREGRPYNGFIYEVKISNLIWNGTLSTPIYVPVHTGLEGVNAFSINEDDRKYFQEFKELSESLLRKMANNKVRNKKVVDEYVANKEKYGKTIIFALTQSHAKNLCKLLQNEHITCDYVTSNRNRNKKQNVCQDIIRRFKENDGIDVLVNVNMLIEGSDVPDVQTVFITRPCNSKTVLAQMIGRALRGKNAKSKNAHGTETAYVVTFHDIWDSYMSFLDPEDIFSKNNTNGQDQSNQDDLNGWITECD